MRRVFLVQNAAHEAESDTVESFPLISGSRLDAPLAQDGARDDRHGCHGVLPLDLREYASVEPKWSPTERKRIAIRERDRQEEMESEGGREVEWGVYVYLAGRHGQLEFPPCLPYMHSVQAWQPTAIGMWTSRQACCRSWEPYWAGSLTGSLQNATR